MEENNLQMGNIETKQETAPGLRERGQVCLVTMVMACYGGGGKLTQDCSVCRGGSL